MRRVFIRFLQQNTSGRKAPARGLFSSPGAHLYTLIIHQQLLLVSIFVIVCPNNFLIGNNNICGNIKVPFGKRFFR